jgi:hypothetical protein
VQNPPEMKISSLSKLNTGDNEKLDSALSYQNVTIAPLLIAEQEVEAEPTGPTPIKKDAKQETLPSSSFSTLREENNPTSAIPSAETSARPTDNSEKGPHSKHQKRDKNSQKHSPKNEIIGPKTEEDDAKKRQGWPDRAPFSSALNKSTKKLLEKYTFWSDLTWQEKITHRTEFLRLYFMETNKCFPYVRRLFVMIYCISPWRAVLILALNIVSGLLPALTLQTRGNFIRMVLSLSTMLINSYNGALRKEL